MIIASCCNLDESTSALMHSPCSKRLRTLKVFKDRTVSNYIALDQALLQMLIVIYVIDDGSLVQSGNHQELRKKEGHYLEFVTSK